MVVCVGEETEINTIRTESDWPKKGKDRDGKQKERNELSGWVGTPHPLRLNKVES